MIYGIKPGSASGRPNFHFLAREDYHSIQPEFIKRSKYFSYCPLESYSVNIKDTGNQLFIGKQSYLQGHDLTTRHALRQQWFKFSVILLLTFPFPISLL